MKAPFTSWFRPKSIHIHELTTENKQDDEGSSDRTLMHTRAGPYQAGHATARGLGSCSSLKSHPDIWLLQIPGDHTEELFFKKLLPSLSGRNSDTHSKSWETLFCWGVGIQCAPPPPLGSCFCLYLVGPSTVRIPESPSPSCAGKARSHWDFTGEFHNQKRKRKGLHTHLINPQHVEFTAESPAEPGQGTGTSSHRAPSQANQYHFPVLELGNYEGERLPDLSPALHYFADIKINCLILGKHMLQFKLSALVCSGIICIDLPASSQFCLLTSWIIREGALGELKSGMKKKYEEE